MKNTSRYFAAAFAVIAAASCAKQEINAPEDNTPAGTYVYTLNVTQEDTKVSMDGLSVLWSANDKIAVSGTDATNTYDKASSFGAATIYDSDNYEPSTSATFTLGMPEDYTPKVAAYPYDGEIKMTSGDGVDNGVVCPVTIPSTQTGIADNLPSGAFAMVGAISGDNCMMSNVGAVIQFKIKNSNITSLRFEGNNSEIISGKRWYFTKAGTTETSTVGSVATMRDTEATEDNTHVTLIPENGTFAAGTYYFVVSPNDLTDGFTMTLTSKAGQTASRKTPAEFNIARNHKYTNFGEDDWFVNISTGAAGNLGTEDGTTATLYGILNDKDGEIPAGDTYGFEISEDGETWTKYNGDVTLRIAGDGLYYHTLTAELTELTPQVTYYYRAYYTTATGVTTYAPAKSFKTFANAESAVIELYGGWDLNYWPFETPALVTEGTGIKKGDSKVAVNKGTDLEMTTKDGRIFIAKATKGEWIGNGNGCFTMGVSEGDYIKLPVIEGKKPASVTLVAGSDGSNGTLGIPSIVTVGKDDADADTYTLATGGNQWNPSPIYMYKSYSWYLDTATGEHAIYFNGSANCYISYLEVVYVDEDEEVEVEDPRPKEIVQDLVFSIGTGSEYENEDEKWPFTTKQGSYTSVTSPVGPFSTSDRPDIEYKFYIADPKAAKENWDTTAGQGLRFGGAIGDYMEICPVEDYKLTKIKIRGGNKAAQYTVTDAKNNVISGGDLVKMANVYDTEQEFVLTGTTANTEYRLMVNSTMQSAIREMWITYELVK